MAINLYTILENIESILKDNNTNTSDYDISNGLNKRVKVFHKGVRGLHETIPVLKSLYPAIFIELDNKVEEFGSMGNTAKRDMDVAVDVVAVSDYNAGGSEAKETADKEIIVLSQNIESLLRNNIRISMTSSILQHVTNTDYSVNIEETTYNCMSRVSLTLKAWST